jgi:hypothetical protein
MSGVAAVVVAAIGEIASGTATAGIATAGSATAGGFTAAASAALPGRATKSGKSPIRCVCWADALAPENESSSAARNAHFRQIDGKNRILFEILSA